MISVLGFAVVAYCVVGLGLMAQGLRYLRACRVMHYHTDVLKERWTQLSVAEQRLMLGLLKGFGAGMFCLGIAVVFIAVEPLRHGGGRAHWFLAFISIMYTAMLVHITRESLLPGAAPIAVTIAMCTLCVAAAGASIAASL